MFGGTAAEAFDRAGARRSLVCRLTTLVASGVLVTEFDSVAESLTFVAAHGIGNEDFDVVSNVAGEKSGRQGGCLEGKAEQTGVTPLSIFEGRQSAHMRDTFRAESFEDVVL